MRRLIPLLLILLPALTFAQTTSNPLTWNKLEGDPNRTVAIMPSGAPGLGSRVLTVCPEGRPKCEYSVACGAATSSLTSTCAAGSAYIAAEALTPTCANPVVLDLGPGTYPEVLRIDNIKGLSVRGAGMDATKIEFYSSDSDILSIGTITSTARATDCISVSDLTVYNELGKTTAPPAILGKAPGAGNEASWGGVRFERVRLVSPNYAIIVRGSAKGGDTGIPGFTCLDCELIGGERPIISYGYLRADIFSGKALAVSNYYELDQSLDSDVAYFLGQITGSIQSGPDNSIGELQADPNACTDNFFTGSLATNNSEILRGRKITLSGASCGDADGLDGYEAWITDTDTTPGQEPNCGYSFLPQTAGEIPDTGCTYTIEAVANLGFARGVTPYSWPHNAEKKNSMGIISLLGQSETASPPSDAHFRFIGTRADVLVNTYAPFNSITSVGVAAVNHVSGGRLQDVTFQNVMLNIGLNVDMYDGCAGADCLSAYSGNGVSAKSGMISGRVRFNNSEIRITNTADADVSSAVIFTNGTGEVVELDGSYLKLDNSVGGYAGTETYLKGTSGTLRVGPLTASEPISTSGTIALMTGGRFSGSGTLDFNFGGGADQGTCLAAQTITVPGAALSDPVHLGLPNGSEIAGVQWKSWVSAANTVSVLPCCVTAADCADTASGTYSATVTRP